MIGHIHIHLENIASRVQEMLPGGSAPRRFALAVFLANLIAVSAVITAFTLFLSQITPYHMDEVLVHHALACLRAPLNAENVFLEACGRYDLNVWIPLFGSVRLPLRSFEYVGSIASLFYLPLYFIWDHPLSNRVLGMLALGVQAWALHRLFRVSWLLTTGLLLGFFPYAFQHFVDTGQLCLQTTLLLVLGVVVQRWAARLQENRLTAALAYAGTSGLLLALGFLLRLSFVFVTPGALLVLTAYLGFQLWQGSFQGKRLLTSSCVFVICFGIPVELLLTAENSAGLPYYASMSKYSSPLALLLNPWAYYEHLLVLLPFILRPMWSAHVLFNVEPASTFGTWFNYGIGAIFALSFVRAAGRRQQLLACTCYLAGVITFLIVGLSSMSWAMHHVVLSYPFFIVGIAAQWSGYGHRKSRKVSALIWIWFFLSGASLYWHLRQLPPAQEAIVGVIATNRYISQNFATDHVIVVVDWGLYYVQALYGPRSQSVLFVDRPGDFHLAARISSIATRLNRKLLIATSNGDPERLLELKRRHPGLSMTPIKVADGPWHLWIEK